MDDIEQEFFLGIEVMLCRIGLCDLWTDIDFSEKELFPSLLDLFGGVVGQTDAVGGCGLLKVNLMELCNLFFVDEMQLDQSAFKPQPFKGRFDNPFQLCILHLYG